MTTRVRISSLRLESLSPTFLSFALAISLAVSAGCTSASDGALDGFARWYESARAQAQAGTLSWSELYKRSFDRLAALPSSFQQDLRLESTVMLLSTARKFEANEINAQQFSMEREHIETRLQARLR